MAPGKRVLRDIILHHRKFYPYRAIRTETSEPVASSLYHKFTYYVNG